MPCEKIRMLSISSLRQTVASDSFARMDSLSPRLCNKHQDSDGVRWMTMILVFFSLAVVTTGQTALTTQNTGFCDQIIKPYGPYNCTEYMVTTFDNFVLSVQLIQRSDWLSNQKAGDVLFWHSSLVGGESWFVADSPTPLALADAGYSVWIANARTTQYTFGHQILKPTQKEYWNWDMDELANYDFPAITDFIHYATHGEKFHFIGYSQGARVGIGAISYQWNRATMLKSVTLLAPVVFMLNTLSPVLIAYNYTRLAELGYELGFGKSSFTVGVGSVQASHTIDKAGILGSIGNAVQSSEKIIDLKKEGLCQFTGPNCCVDYDKVFSVLTGPYSATSFKNLAHLTQSMKEQVFRAYDFGSPSANTEIYQNSVPPTYHLQQVPNSIPIFVAYGGNDRLTSPTDVSYFISQLSTTPTVLFQPTYAHLDFLFSKSMALDINLPILNFIGLANQMP